MGVVFANERALVFVVDVNPWKLNNTTPLWGPAVITSWGKGLVCSCFPLNVKRTVSSKTSSRLWFYGQEMSIHFPYYLRVPVTSKAMGF